MVKGKFFILICLFLLLFIVISCGRTPNNPQSAVKIAFEQWSQNNGVPYKDVQNNIISNDGTFAVVSIIGYFRESSEADWVEMQAYVEVRKVGGSWQCEDNQFFGLTPKTSVGSLMEACSKGYIEEVKKILKQGADANEKDEYGKTPLMYAIHNGNFEIASLLIDNGADVNVKDEYGTAILKITVSSRNFEIASLLIDNGADVNVIDGDGKTILMEAAFYGHNDIASFIIDKGADVNAKGSSDYADDTALSFAASWGSIEIAKLLIDNGADVNAKDNDGGTALSLAIGWELDEFINLLREKGAQE